MVLLQYALAKSYIVSIFSTRTQKAPRGYFNVHRNTEMGESEIHRFCVPIHVGTSRFTFEKIPL